MCGVGFVHAFAERIGDLNCMLQATNKEQSIRIQSSGGLSEEQIQQMVRDSEAHAEQDKRRKQAIEAKNEAETAIYSAEKSVGEWKDKARSALAALNSRAACRVDVHLCLALCWQCLRFIFIPFIIL